eukprot:TRINITY_DN3671_c0_g3_i1.p1 TRINITY_DN3671_c0_g3~~TRINITY_DN3671_c0_g3_i1.p1  ORF type:complete len:675 (-),score=177.18 TRINITY_DN3671_c0_g3_i1:69-2093(-)
MGNSAAQPVIYSVPIGNTQTRGETPVHRNPNSKEGQLPWTPDPAIQSLKDNFIRAKDTYGSKPFLMWRQPPTGNQTLGSYTSMSYLEAFDVATNLGRGIVGLGLTQVLKEYKDYALQFVGIYSKNRREWILIDQASVLFGVTVVPIYDTLGPEAVRFVYQQTNLTTMFCTSDHIASIIKDKKAGFTNKLETIVAMDIASKEAQQSVIDAGLRFYQFEDVVEEGKKRQSIPYANVKPTDVYTFSYTSGTTGTPKAAMLTHQNLLSVILGAKRHNGININETSVHLSYLPLAHVMERIVVSICVYGGATIAFYNGDPLKLKEDLAEVRPTFFASVPRLFNRFHDVINGNFNNVQGCKRSLVNSAVASKLANVRRAADYKHWFYDCLVFNKVKAVFGGRVQFMITGSAPISTDVIDFFKLSAGCPVFEGYGQTESTGASFATTLGDPQSGHVGGPLVQLEFKLVDVPEMNYTSQDRNDQGQPAPRGEICMKGPSVIPGYYKDPEKTAETIDRDGWLHTGDIGTILPNGALKIIDRKKNIFKLQQGEYVAPEKIEGVYVLSPLVAEAFVYGDSLKNHLIGVMVPKREGLMKFAQEKGVQGTFDELIQNKAFVKQVTKELETFGRANKLLGFELVKQIHLEPKSFVDLELVTPSFKLVRATARKHYQAILDKLYEMPIE